MPFQSRLPPGILVIDDSTPDDVFSPGTEFSTGYKGMFRSSQSADEISVPLPKELLIPEADWEGMIKEQENQESTIFDQVELAGLPCKDQAQTNFCWANAPTHVSEIVRVVQNEPMVILSPASVACPINGFKNRGGFGEDALRQIIDVGISPTSKWPANAIDRQYDTPENQKLRADFRATGWYRLTPRSKQELISCLLRRMPVAVGLNWWGHEVTFYQAVWVNGMIGVKFRNSWGMNWPNPGARGYSVLQGTKMLPDDGVTIRSMNAM